MPRYRLALFLGFLALTPVAAGCTGAGPDNASGLDDEDQALALEYSECMRDNGIADFPDPQENSGGGGGGLALPDSIDDESEDFQAAQEACVEFMPGPAPEDLIDADTYAELLDYVECVREQGIENFPDPEEDGISVHFEELGIDPDSEEYQAALAACEDEIPDDAGVMHNGSDG